ncbi:conserved hypothethical protein (plasmid) [Ralstonia solanacearum CMR15]|nr:conserved hypothethical protein [Ralstonia solanacearum CMR15]
MAIGIKHALAGFACMAALTGHAYSAVISCPSVSDIKQTPGEYGGFAYTAPLPNGQQWTGENPMADEADLGRVVFQEAYIVNAKNFVACDYVGKKAAGMRMVLKTASPIRPAGAAWKWQRQADGTVLPHCVGPNPTQCTFE